jgi:hypothetical protein
MGVLTDLIIAEESEAEAVAAMKGPLQRWPGIDAKGVDHIKLGKLLSIVTNTPYQNSFVGEFVQIAEASDDGPWVFRVPPRLVAPLAAMAGDDIGPVSAQWAATEEFALSGWDEASVAQMLASICGLSKQAAAEGKSLLMWMCL